MDLLTTDQDHWQHHVANTGQQVGGVRSAVQPNGSLVIVIKDVTFMKKTDFYREFRIGNGLFLRSDLRNGTHLLIATAERRDLDLASYTAGYQYSTAVVLLLFFKNSTAMYSRTVRVTSVMLLRNYCTAVYAVYACINLFVLVNLYSGNNLGPSQDRPIQTI